MGFKQSLHAVGDLLLVTIRSFCAALLLMLCLAVVLAGATYYLLAERHFWYGVVGAVVVVLEVLIVGVFWAGKRALVVTIIHALDQHRLGKAIIGMIFERILDTSQPQAAGERGGLIARSLERLPLAQAERRLSETVNHLLQAPETGGALSRRLRFWLRVRLLRYVQACTLTRFRDSEAQHGGVDLLLVKADLENRLDSLLVGKLRRGLRLGTWIVLLGMPAQVVAALYITLAFLK